MSRTWHICFAAGLLLGTTLGLDPAKVAAEPAPPRAAVQTPTSFEKLTLPNGLVVLLNVDHRAPLVGYDLDFRGGSRVDPPGRRGMAVLMRHVLMHASTRHVREQDRGAILETLDVPKWTAEVRGNVDHTWLQAQVPAGALELALWLESDRLAFIEDGIDEDAVRKAIEETEREVGHLQDTIDARLDVALFGSVWGDGHPYGGFVNGPPEIAGVTPAEVRARLRAWYGPANVVLALSGDFDVALTRELCAQHFGGIVGAARPVRPPLPAAALHGERRIRIEADVDAPRVALAWPTPAYFEEDDALLDVAAAILAARLRQRLVVGAEVATDVAVTEVSRQAGSVFQLRMTLRAGHSAVEGLAAADQELAQLRAAEPPEGELRGIRLSLFTSSTTRLDRPLSRALELAGAESATGDPSRLSLGQATYLGATAAAVHRVAAAYLAPDRRVVAEVVPTRGAPPNGRIVAENQP